MICHKVVLRSSLNSILPNFLPQHTVQKRRFLSRLVVAMLAALLSIALLDSATLAANQPSVAQPLHPSVAKLQTDSTCLELVVNGGFEQTGEGWQALEGASLFTYAPDYFVGGERSLQLGFTAPSDTAAIFAAQQRIALPTESTRIELSFYSTAMLEGQASPADQAYLAISDIESGQLLSQIPLWPPTSDVVTDAANTFVVGQNTWNIGRYDLTPIAGKTIDVAFVVEDDGEPGRLLLRVDEVSVFACVPPEIYALLAQPTPIVETSSPTLGSETVFTPTTLISSLDRCDCSAQLHQCSDFASWSIAQACFMQCQVNAGYDIHLLDADGNGIACELELQDIPALDMSPSLQPDDLSAIEPTTVTGVVTTALPSGTTVLSPTPQSGVIAWSEIASAEITPTASVPVSLTDPALSISSPVTLANASAITETDASITAPITTDLAASPPNSPTSTDSLVELLFSPLGYLAIGVLVILGALGLVAAYLIGQRSQAKNSLDRGAPASTDFTLQDDDERFRPKP